MKHASGPHEGRLAGIVVQPTSDLHRWQRNYFTRLSSVKGGPPRRSCSPRRIFAFE